MARSEGNNTLGILGVASGVMMAGLYSEGNFSYWDMMPGMLILAITISYWNLISFDFFPNIALSIMMAGGGVMLIGVFIEPYLLEQYSPLKLTTEKIKIYRSDCFALIWLILTLIVCAARHFKLGKKNG